MISEVNEVSPGEHKRHAAGIEFLKNTQELSDQNFSNLITAVQALQVAIPSWALGTGGTRFGRFPEGGEPRTLEEKIEDVGIIRNLTRATNSVSLHIPWDIPKDVPAIQQMLNARGLVIDSV